MIAVCSDSRVSAPVLCSGSAGGRIGADPVIKDHMSYSGPSGRSFRILTCVLGSSAVPLMNESVKSMSLPIRKTSKLRVRDITSMRTSQKLAARSRLTLDPRLCSWAALPPIPQLRTSYWGCVLL